MNSVNLTAVYCVAIITVFAIAFILFFFTPITWPKVIVAIIAECCVEVFVRHAENYNKNTD